MAIALALVSALCAGTGDFWGAAAARRGRTHAVATWSQVAGLATAIALVAIIGGDPSGADLAWGAGAGTASGLAILALYSGLARSDVSIVSPITAVGAAGWPVLYSLATGDTPTAVQGVGLGIGIVAIALISASRLPAQVVGRDRAAGVGFGLAAGLGLGLTFILLGEIGDAAEMWPLVPARAAGSAVLFVVLVVARHPVRPVRGAVPSVIGAGAITAAANGLFILAANRGSLAVVAVLTAMFPAATVVLARLVWNERLDRHRLLGLGLALGAVGLVAGG